MVIEATELTWRDQVELEATRKNIRRAIQDAAGEPSVTSFGRVKLRVVTRGSDMPRGLYRGSPAASIQVRFGHVTPEVEELINNTASDTDLDALFDRALLARTENDVLRADP